MRKTGIHGLLFGLCLVALSAGACSKHPRPEGPLREAAVDIRVSLDGASEATKALADFSNGSNYGIFACVMSILFCGPVTRLFLGAPPEAVTDYVFRYLSTTTPFYISLSAILVYRNALQGLDYQIVPFLGGVLELIGRGAFVFPLLAWLGYEGVAATNAVAWIPAALLDYLYYRVKVPGVRHHVPGV